MAAVMFRYRLRARRYWRSWALLALLSGIALSLSMAAAGDARRAHSALSRALRAERSADLVVNANETALGRDDSASYMAAVDRLPGIAVSSRVGGVNLSEVNDDGTLGTRLFLNTALGKHRSHTASPPRPERGGAISRSCRLSDGSAVRRAPSSCGKP